MISIAAYKLIALVIATFALNAMIITHYLTKWRSETPPRIYPPNNLSSSKLLSNGMWHVERMANTKTDYNVPIWHSMGYSFETPAEAEEAMKYMTMNNPNLCLRVKYHAELNS